MAGLTKTRLIPVLGSQGAANLSKQLTESTLTKVRRFCGIANISLEIRYDGTGRSLIREWLGSLPLLRRQGGGNLGCRMSRAARNAFLSGMQRVVIIGTDCPKMSDTHLKDAFDALRKETLVIGPASDGGYYLIAFGRNAPKLFENIEWGTNRVPDQTMTQARKLGLEPRLLETLDDIDRPEDLPIWEKERGV